MVLSREVTHATKRKFAITGLKLKDALKQVTTQIEIKGRAAISRICTKLERDDSEELQNFATCQAVLHNRAADFCCILPDTTDSVAIFDANNAVVGLGETEGAMSDQLSKYCTETGGTKDQL